MKDKKEMVRNATLNILKDDFLYYVAVGKNFRERCTPHNPRSVVFAFA